MAANGNGTNGVGPTMDLRDYVRRLEDNITEPHMDPGAGFREAVGMGKTFGEALSRTRINDRASIKRIARIIVADLEWVDDDSPLADEPFFPLPPSSQYVDIEMRLNVSELGKGRQEAVMVATGTVRGEVLVNQKGFKDK